MRGNLTATLLSLFVLLMLVSGEEELVRVKRLHNAGPAISKNIPLDPSTPGIQMPGGNDNGGNLHATHPSLDASSSTETRGISNGGRSRRSALIPLLESAGVKIRRRMRRMAEDASYHLKRGAMHLIGNDGAVIDGRGLKRERRHARRRSTR